MRTVVAQLRDDIAAAFGTNLPGPDAWMFEVHSVCVVAHAQHGRLDLIEDIVEQLPANLAAMLSDPAVAPAVQDLPIGGALLVALGMVDIARGATASGARLVALAERLHYLRNFPPTMSSARVRKVAQDADGPAYADAVSEYAGLDRAGLIAEALALAGVTPARG
jgi:hypothetical protein